MAALAGDRPPRALAEETHGAAGAFATRAYPGWPAYTRDRGAVMRFGDPSRVVDDGYHDVRPLVGDSLLEIGFARDFSDMSESLPPSEPFGRYFSDMSRVVAGLRPDAPRAAAATPR